MPVNCVPRTGNLAGGGARRRAVDGEALGERGSEVGEAERDDLALGVDVVAIPVGEAARGRERHGEDYERDAGRFGGEQRQAVKRQRRPGERRQQSALHDVERGDAERVQPEELHGAARHDERDQRRRNARQHPGRAGEHGERAEADGERRPVRLGNPAEEVCAPRDDAVARDAYAEEATALARHDVECDAVQEADEDRFRQEAGEAAEAERARGDEDQSGDERQAIA
jgi:hypothetical protein